MAKLDKKCLQAKQLKIPLLGCDTLPQQYMQAPKAKFFDLPKQEHKTLQLQTEKQDCLSLH